MVPNPSAIAHQQKDLFSQPSKVIKGQAKSTLPGLPKMPVRFIEENLRQKAAGPDPPLGLPAHWFHPFSPLLKVTCVP